MKNQFSRASEKIRSHFFSRFFEIETLVNDWFMGIPATGKRIEIRYMDFWKVVDGKIVDNWVSVDFPHVMAQLGKDAFEGNGWEVYDRSERVPPAPKEK